MTLTTFAVIGTGWRSEFYLRLAAMAPEHFRVTGVISRNAARGAEIAERWGTSSYAGIGDLLAHARPQFVIPAVPWPAMPGAITELVSLGLPTLAETPPAPDVEGLRSLWSAVGGSGLVQVAEQYTRMPGHAAQLALVGAGVVGEATSVQISSTHLYHAVSLIRRLLGVGFETAKVTARSFSAPLVDPLVLGTWTGSTEPAPASTTLATIDFGGRMGLYDFTDNQWWNPLRARRIVIRGSRGELVDDRVVRMLDAMTPGESRLVRRQRGIDLNLEGSDLDHISLDGVILYRNAFAGARFSDDDLAVASLLHATGEWARQVGPEPYPLAEACQDHLIGCAIGDAARTGLDVTTGAQPWAR